jgi:hypothetical protein
VIGIQGDYDWADAGSSIFACVLVLNALAY